MPEMSIETDKVSYARGEVVNLTITKPLLTKAFFLVKGLGITADMLNRGRRRTVTSTFTIPTERVGAGTYEVVEGIAYIGGSPRWEKPLIPTIIIAKAPRTTFEVS